MPYSTLDSSKGFLLFQPWLRPTKLCFKWFSRPNLLYLKRYFLSSSASPISALMQHSGDSNQLYFTTNLR